MMISTKGVLATLAVLAVASFAAAAEVDVSPSNLNGWVPSATPPATVGFVAGPGTPPCGTGSAHFTIDASGATNAQLRNVAYNGTLLSTITALSYATYNAPTESGGQAVYVILNVDLDNNGTTDDQLFFEPVYQTGAYSGDPVPNQGTVTSGVWQTWDAFVGGWWSLDAATFGPPLVTLANYIAANPGARLAAPASGAGSVRLVTGFGGPSDWGSFDGNADCFTIGISGNDTTYDFELVGDSDGDGVPDGSDDCVPSDLRPFVDVNGAEPGATSVPNTVDANGCSIQDHVNACAATAKNHGHYVKCIKELSSRLQSEGVITKAQAKEMHTGAAKSDVGK